MFRPAKRLSVAAALPLACVLDMVFAGPASAHIKWFCAYDVASQPVGLENVLCPDFELLTGLSLLGLLTGSAVEGTVLGNAILRAFDQATSYIRDNIEIIFRTACAFFFISIWAVGGFLLTPELKANSIGIGVLQLAIAGGMLSRRTMPLSAFGIVALFDIAVWDYGGFHLADYPIFLGFAAYIALVGCQTDFFGVRPIDVLRYAASITLMWASIEKWAYPQWSYPLLIQHPEMTLGFAPDFYMRAAGAIEFALAFSLLWTPLVRRVGAIMLATMFVSAVFAFGKIDLIGHSLIVVSLLGIIVDDGGKPARMRDFWLMPAAYTGSLALFLWTYYMVHAGLFGTTVL